MKKNAILFSASNYTKSPLIQIDDLPGVKYDIQAMHKRLTQIGFEVKQIENKFDAGNTGTLLELIPLCEPFHLYRSSFKDK